MAIRKVCSKKISDLKDHFKIEGDEKFILVITKNRSYRFSMGKEELLKRYLKNRSLFEVTKEEIKLDDETIFFTKNELFRIKQEIVLLWIRVGVAGNLDHPQTLDIVRYASSDKYGFMDKRSFLLEASTLSVDLDDYMNFLEAREEFERRQVSIH